MHTPYDLLLTKCGLVSARFIKLPKSCWSLCCTGDDAFLQIRYALTDDMTAQVCQVHSAVALPSMEG
jgi:hypothetical protein